MKSCKSDLNIEGKIQVMNVATLPSPAVKKQNAERTNWPSLFPSSSLLLFINF